MVMTAGIFYHQSYFASNDPNSDFLISPACLLYSSTSRVVPLLVAVPLLENSNYSSLVVYTRLVLFEKVVLLDHHNHHPVHTHTHTHTQTIRLLSSP